MLPIFLCSVISLTIVIERFWVIREENVAPKKLISSVCLALQIGNKENAAILELGKNPFLGALFSAALAKKNSGVEAMRLAAESSSAFVANELDRYLGALGTIAAITPLLGLLGTVFGMITVFGVMESSGAGDASVLAGGISEALVTTAAGLSVAIPSLFFQRYFERRVDELMVLLGHDIEKLIELLSEE